MSATTQDIIDQHEAATMLNLSANTVMRRVRSGELPGKKISQRQYRFSRQALIEWIAYGDVRSANASPIRNGSPSRRTQQSDRQRMRQICTTKSGRGRQPAAIDQV